MILYPCMHMLDEYIPMCIDLEQRLLESLKGEQDARKYYEKLITMTSSEEDKNIISKIYKDEGEHFNNFRRFYIQLTGRQPMLPSPETPNIPNYIEGIKKAIMDEIDTYGFYKDTYLCTNNPIAKEIFLDAFTDENGHAVTFNYLFTKNK